MKNTRDLCASFPGLAERLQEEVSELMPSTSHVQVCKSWTLYLPLLIRVWRYKIKYKKRELLQKRSHYNHDHNHNRFKELFCKPKQLDEVKTFSKMSKHVQSPRDCRVTRNVKSEMKLKRKLNGSHKQKARKWINDFLWSCMCLKPLGLRVKFTPF